MAQRTAIQGGSLRGAVVHMIFVLALFRICSSDERNIRPHHDISRQVEKGLIAAKTSVSAANAFASILAYDAGVGGSNPSPPTESPVQMACFLAL
jgi:hypothetical protein